VVAISSLLLKQLALRWQKVSSVIKVVVCYPGDVVREKKKDFPGAANALIALLACFYIAVFIFYFNFGLSGYLLPWSGVVDRIEYKAPAVANMPDVSVVHVLKDGAAKELVLYEMPQQKINLLQINKGSKVRKPMLYTDVLFGEEKALFSSTVSDFMFFIFGVLLLGFALVSGGSFIAIIFASVFMIKSKYAKK